MTKYQHVATQLDDWGLQIEVNQPTKPMLLGFNCQALSQCKTMMMFTQQSRMNLLLGQTITHNLQLQETSYLLGPLRKVKTQWEQANSKEHLITHHFFIRHHRKGTFEVPVNERPAEIK